MAGFQTTIGDARRGAPLACGLLLVCVVASPSCDAELAEEDVVVPTALPPVDPDGSLGASPHPAAAPDPQSLFYIAAGDGGFALDGQAVSSFAGAAMAGVGDVNTDGVADFLVGAPSSSAAGRTYLVFGESDFPAGPFDLGSSSQGVAILEMIGMQTADGCGSAVAGGGDFNGDGLPDFIVGAWGSDDAATNAGRSYVVYGHPGLATSAWHFSNIELGWGTGNAYGFVIEGEFAEDRAGESVANAGDVNGDGLDDFLIGAGSADPNGAGSGRSYLIYGSEDALVGGVLSLADIADGVGGIAIDGAAAGDNAGYVNAAGDVNADGFDDIVIGASRADPNGSGSGRAYVVYGDDDLGPSPLQLAQVALGNGGFALDGELGSDFAGFAVSGAGDVNDDGFDDVLIGAYGNDAGASGAGRGYIVYGAATMPGSPIDLADIVSGSGGVALTGIAASDDTGWAVGAAGDVNLDGLDDVLISARRRDAGGTDRGTAFLVFGADDPAIASATNVLSGITSSFTPCGGFAKWGEANVDRAGHVVVGLGDVNDDGLPDIGVGAQDADPNGSASGRAYVVFGDADLGTYCSAYNRNPRPTNDVYYGVQDSDPYVPAPGVLANDWDADDDPIVVTTPGGFTAMGGYAVFWPDGRFSYQAPDAAWWGADEVEYSVSDGQGGAATATVRVLITPSNVPLDDVAYGGFVMNGYAANEGAGQAVAIVGDVTQPPEADILIGAFEADPDALDSAGVTYMRLGTDNVITGPIQLSPDEDDALGESPFDWSGISVAPAGDFDGDGQADFLIGAIGADANGSRSGRAYLAFGVGGEELQGLLAAIDGTSGVRFEGESPQDDAGRAIAAAGDVNGDGLDDIIIGAYRSDLGDADDEDFGRAYVVYGTNAALPASLELADVGGSVDGFVIDGEAPGDFAGFAVGGGVNVDRNRYDDVIVGAYFADPTGDASGRTYVIYGGNAIPPLVALSDVADPLAMPDLGIAIDGEEAGDWSGRTVAGVGDIDGDGDGDILVGAPAASFTGAGSGRVYVVFGGATMDGGSPNISLANVALGTGGFALDGEAQDDAAGTSLSTAADLNADGFADFILGAPYASPTPWPWASRSGAAYVIFGKSNWSGTSVVSLADIGQEIGGFSIDGQASFDGAGHSVGGGDDVNYDGFPDVVVGAPNAGPSHAGKAYVIFGGDWFPPQGVVP